MMKPKNRKGFQTMSSLITTLDDLDRFQKNKAADSVSRAIEAYAMAISVARKRELAAIAYGKLLAYYNLDLINGKDFHVYRHILGY